MNTDSFLYDEKQKPLKLSLLWNHCLISFVQYCNQTRKSYDPSKSIRMFGWRMRRTRQISKQRKLIDLYNFRKWKRCGKWNLRLRKFRITTKTAAFPCPETFSLTTCFRRWKRCGNTSLSSPFKRHRKYGNTTDTQISRCGNSQFRQKTAVFPRPETCYFILWVLQHCILFPVLWPLFHFAELWFSVCYL